MSIGSEEFIVLEDEEGGEWKVSVSISGVLQTEPYEAEDAAIEVPDATEEDVDINLWD